MPGAQFIRAAPRASVVKALESKECALDVEQNNLLALDVDESSLSRCDLIRPRHPHNVGHALFSSIAATALKVAPERRLSSKRDSSGSCELESHDPRPPGRPPVDLGCCRQPPYQARSIHRLVEESHQTPRTAISS